VTNQTGIDNRYHRTAEVLQEKGGQVSAIFGPEHGYYGVEQDALPVADIAQDRWSGVPVYSLYRAEDLALGKEHLAFSPPPGSLDNLDALVFDIQDVGVRYYTYPTTLGILMETVNLPIIIIDRPNPIDGVTVEGPGLQSEFSSFVGRYNVPVRHGLTIGELAQLINNLYLKGKAQIEVVRLEGWRREMLFEDTALPWVLPSPNLPTLETARLYPGTCLLEGTNLSVGRGTTRPFEFFGAPWINPTRLAQELNRRQLPGLYFRETYFKPAFDRFVGEVCGGVQAHITTKPGPDQIVRSGLEIIAAVLRLYPDYFNWLPVHFDRLIGSVPPRQILVLAEGDYAALDPLFDEWHAQEEQFHNLRQDYLLYD
jgi:uncharacterized protein YbbC (DUF1343 family)